MNAYDGQEDSYHVIRVGGDDGKGNSLSPAIKSDLIGSVSQCLDASLAYRCYVRIMLGLYFRIQPNLQLRTPQLRRLKIATGFEASERNRNHSAASVIFTCDVQQT